MNHNNTKRNNLISFFGLLLFIYLVVTSSCSPSLGASWYAKSGGKGNGVQMCITSIKVAEKQVEVNDPEYRSVGGEAVFSKAKRFAITVPFSVKAIDVGNIQIEAYENERKEAPLKISYEIEGDSVPLVPGDAISVILRIKDDAGRFRVEEKFISITREAPQAVDLALEKLEVFGVEASWNDEGKSGAVDVPYSKGTSVVAGDIKATFRVGNETKTLPVVVEGNEIELKIGEVVQVSCSIEAKQWEYNAYSFTLNCKRLEKQEGEEEPLKLKYLSVHKIDARNGLVRVGQEVTHITAQDVVAIFETFETLPVKLQKDIVTFDSAGAAELELTVEGKPGEYSEWKRTVHVVKEGGGDPSSPDASDEDNSGNHGETEPDFPQLKNPKDEKGNEKFIVKLNVTEEEIDPFDYFKETAGGFSANAFDGWVLNMTSMTSDNVASYSFLPGSWEEGNPPTCTSADIGNGQFNHTWNLKYYKYKNQEERWAERSDYNSTLTPEEKKRRERFLFFKFTGDAAMGTHLDNSMFCVDTVTKFLFYYSAPRDISSFGVPSNWRDYDEASEGSHIHSDVPFYLTDPVGYVEKDGKCVIYGWCKQHIRKNDYTPSIDKMFRKVAARRPGGHGYSPYRDKIKKVKKERVVTTNPEYTAEKPVIISQSSSLYLTLDDSEDAVVSVKLKDAPEKEELSYQWYTNTTNQTEGAIAIDGGTKASHKFEKQVMDIYCWCIITNKNTENGKQATTSSQAVKVRIAKSAQDLKIDAETPIIIEHPKSSKLSFVQGKKVEVLLQVKVKKPSDKGVLSYQWFENSQETAEGGRKIEDATEATYKASISDAGIKYYYCEVTNTSAKATGEKSISVASAVAKVEVEELYELNISCVGEGELEVIGGNSAGIIVKDNGTTQLQVHMGTKLFLLATPSKGWEVEKWDGEVETLGGIKNARIILKDKDTIEKGVSVTFRKIPKKGLFGISSITIENISLWGWMWGKWYDFTYFDWNMQVGVEDDREGCVYTSIWANEKIRFMKKDKGASAYVMPSDKSKDLEVLLEKDKATVKLASMLHKKDSSELGGNYVNHWDICLPDKNVIELEYNKNEDAWMLKNCKYDKASQSWIVEEGVFDQIPKVTIDINKNEETGKCKDFVLKRGETKQLSITYNVDDYNNSAQGAVKVTYTLNWE